MPYYQLRQFALGFIQTTIDDRLEILNRNNLESVNKKKEIDFNRTTIIPYVNNLTQVTNYLKGTHMMEACALINLYDIPLNHDVDASSMELYRNRSSSEARA